MATAERNMTRPGSELPDFPASQLFLRRLAYSLVHDEARAEDLVQDTWAAWIEHRPRGVTEPRAWLARVLRNRAFNLKRGDARRAQHETFAGRPDPSAPETDGTLEAQAKLIAALRELEEPYRSTLVQRYYHDLAPKEIAERSGAPLDTVKSRLARGLEKLRAAMDKRYHGDRRAWCHWLMPLGAPSVGMPTSSPSGPRGAGGAPPQAFGSGSSLLAAIGAAAIVALAAVWRSGWLRTPQPVPRVEAPPAAPPIAERERVPVRTGRVESAPEPDRALPSEQPRRSTFPIAPPPSERVAESGYASGGAPRRAFDWPQYAGGPEHDSSRARTDEIHAPKVLWYVPFCVGQPTLVGGDLYTGGLGLGRLDPDTGIPTGLFLDLFGTELRATGTVASDMARQMAEQLAQMDPNELDSLAPKLNDIDPADHSLDAIAPAPVVTSERVLARFLEDGSVVAFDRRFAEVWRWGRDASDASAPTHRIPLCLTDTGVVLVACDGELVALSESHGDELWRYGFSGTIGMIPAASGGRVFFGIDKGLFVALDAGTGRVLWRRTALGFGASTPMVVGERVFAIDDPDKPWNPDSDRAILHAWSTTNGEALWEVPFSRTGRPSGVSWFRESAQVIATVSVVKTIDSKSGKFPTPFFAGKRRPIGTPVVVGKSLVVADDEGLLDVYESEARKVDERELVLRWAFRPPQHAKVEDFVHTGDRIYVATTIGLFCIADDPTHATPPEGFVLEGDVEAQLSSLFAKAAAGLDEH